MKKIILLFLFSLAFLDLMAQLPKQSFEFEFEGFTINGVLNLPPTQTPKGIVLLVHGAGRTNAVAQELHYDVRAQLVQAGYATYMWDKMGCGKSEGTFDYNQPVQNSADEVIAAIHALQAKKIPGAEDIGLWGISRAGWINPLVIKQYKKIRFWISVSGVDGKENFNYLFEENLRISGMPEDSVQLLAHELKESVRLPYLGAGYERYQAATVNLRKNKFLQRFNNGSQVSEAAYYAYQKNFDKATYDEASGLIIYIPNFDKLLSEVNCPVLALFGEKDKNVDWRKTKALYEATLGPKQNLTIQTFPEGNHNLFKANTGGFYEFQDDGLPWNRCDGFLKAMKDWLDQLEQ